MNLFDFQPEDLARPVENSRLGSHFLTVPKSWESKVGVETLEIVHKLFNNEFLIAYRWKDQDWNHKKFPPFSWCWFDSILDAAIKDTMELEESRIRFRSPDHKYTLKEFLVQDWKDKAHPWSPFLCAVFGTAPKGKIPVPPGKTCAKWLIVKNIELMDCDGSLYDSIYEE